MATRTAVTRRNALNAQPVPGLAGQKSDDRQRALAIRSDAAVAVTWLNAAREAKAMSSYRRVVSIRDDLGELRSKREEVRETFGPDPQAWNAAVEQLQKKKAAQRMAIRRGEKPDPDALSPTAFPSDRGTDADYDKSLRQIERFSISLNARLSKYKFRPAVAYARLPGTISAVQNIWAGGMVPDVKKRWFQTTLNGWPISEGDAVLSLVRLDLSGELHKVALCEMCKKNWRVAAKSHYKFCSGECRVAYYAESPDFNSRKAANQREYREREKRKEAEALKWVLHPKRSD